MFEGVTAENFSRYIIYDNKRGVVNESSELVVAMRVINRGIHPQFWHFDTWYVF